MADIIFFDRVQHTVSISGTSNFTLSAANADTGFRSFTDTSWFDEFASFYIAIVDEANGDWEIGFYTESGTGAFTRTSSAVIASSNSDSQVSFSSGDKKIMFVDPAKARNFLQHKDEEGAPVLLVGNERILAPTDSLSDREGYSTFDGMNGLGDMSDNAVIFGSQGPKRSHQQTQVVRLRTSNDNTQPLYDESLEYSDSSSSYGVTYVKAIVTAIGDVSTGTTFEGLAVEIDAAIVYRSSVGSSVYLYTPNNTTLGSDGTAAGSWTVAVDDSTPPTFKINVTGDTNSVIDWVAEVHIVANGIVPSGEA